VPILSIAFHLNFWLLLWAYQFYRTHLTLWTLFLKALAAVFYLNGDPVKLPLGKRFHQGDSFWVATLRIGTSLIRIERGQFRFPQSHPNPMYPFLQLWFCTFWVWSSHWLPWTQWWSQTYHWFSPYAVSCQ
jgi:hypothetical protein